MALHLERPVAVLERKGRAYLNPAYVYGARDAHGALLHSVAKPGAPETIPTFKLVPIADLIETLRANPTSHSVLEFNGTNHFDPWILKRSLRAAAEAEGEGGGGDGDGEGGGGGGEGGGGGGESEGDGGGGLGDGGGGGGDGGGGGGGGDGDGGGGGDDDDDPFSEDYFLDNYEQDSY